MKEKTKKLIFIISIAYSLVIVVLMLYSYSTSINTIKFSDNNENIKILNEYKERLKNVENSTCKSALNNLINHYERTSYSGEVNLKDMNMNGDGVLNYASAIINNCSLSGEKKDSVAIKMITASAQFDEILQRLLFQYEIKLPDLNNRALYELGMDGIRYNINRKNQLEIIKIIIDILEEEHE